MDKEKIYGKILASDKMANELLASERHTAPMFSSIFLELTQGIELAKDSKDYNEACNTLMESINKARNTAQSASFTLLSAVELYRGRSLAFKEILDEIEALTEDKISEPGKDVAGVDHL